MCHARVLEPVRVGATKRPATVLILIVSRNAFKQLAGELVA